MHCHLPQGSAEVRVYGHRGAPATHPENTLGSFAAAIESGADGLELDVQASADDVPVVLHDRDLERTTNGAGPVDRTAFAAVRTLDAGNGERIPTLAKVLELAGDRAYFDIELKQAGIEAAVLAELERHPRARWAISSFDWTGLERCRALAPDAELWPLATRVSPGLLQVALRIGARAVSLWSHAYNRESAARLHDAGLEVVVWTVNDADGARRARALGATGLCTDDPARTVAALRRP
jgi:glycerophosphoryl diester phosphodiesterase